MNTEKRWGRRYHEDTRTPEEKRRASVLSYLTTAHKAMEAASRHSDDESQKALIDRAVAIVELML